MKTKHWKLSLHKDGNRIALFVTTTDSMVDSDLSKPDGQSLICLARQYHRRAQTQDQDHCDLAVGVLMTHAGEPPYDMAFEHIESISSVPEFSPLDAIPLRGEKRSIPIWEKCDPLHDTEAQ